MGNGCMGMRVNTVCALLFERNNRFCCGAPHGAVAFQPPGCVCMCSPHHPYEYTLDLDLFSAGNLAPLLGRRPLPCSGCCHRCTVCHSMMHRPWCLLL